MATLRAFTMPKWGIEMTEGTVSQWMVAAGTTFRKGDVLALIETDKITNDVEAEFDGTLARALVTAGATVPVGAVLAVVATAPVTDTEVNAFLNGLGLQPTAADATPAAHEAGGPPPSAAAKASPAARVRAAALGVNLGRVPGSGRNGRVSLQDVMLAARRATPRPPRAPVSIAPPPEPAAGVYASPMAHRLAIRHAVDLGPLPGSGPRGRISQRDVLARAPAAAPLSAATDAGPTVLRMSAMRRSIAAALVRSKTTIPHFYVRISAQVDALFELRRLAQGAPRPSINDYVVRATALALREVPDVNVQVHGEDIHRFAQANVAIAVAVPGGLLTPVLRAADTKSVGQIAAESRALAAAARAGRLTAAQLQDGSFTVSNLGMHGVDAFDAIINPPQGAILAVGAARRQPIETRYALTFALLMHLSLSCDHRAIDGATAAAFLGRLRYYLENPEALAP